MCKKVIISFYFLTVLFIAQGCQNSVEKFDVEQWHKGILAHRAETDKEYSTSPESPFAGITRLSLDTIPENYFTYSEREFDLSQEPKKNALLKLSFKNKKWFWEKLNDDVILKSDKQTLAPGKMPNAALDGSFDRFTLTIYPLDEKVVIIVFDPQREAFRNFKHLLYFPPDPQYRVNAKLKRFKDPEKVEMLTSRNLIKTYYRYARVEFNIKGESQVLMAYKQSLASGIGKGWLFIPFRDKTSEIETYAAGRFLEIEEPSGDSFVLDFNLAFNPLCNYAHVYNCSYPPPENHLKIAIPAGEKTYPEEH